MTQDPKPAFTPILLLAPALLALLLFTWSMGHGDLLKREAREGIPVVLMSQGKGWLLPQISENRIRTKPPLYYWSALAASRVRGKVDEVSLRLPSVIAGVGTVFLTTLLGAWLFSPTAGAMAGFTLATGWRFSYLASHARVDMLFALFTTAAFLTLWKMMESEDPSVRSRWSWMASLMLGLAVLTKGPLGLLFPLLALALFRWISGRREYPVPWARLVLLPLAMTLVWVLGAYLENGSAFQAMIYEEIVGRLSGTEKIQVHKEPFYFYLPQIFLDLAPWSLFLPAALWRGIRERRRDARWLYPALSFLLLIGFLSLFKGKRGDYLLPLYPMAALILADYFNRYRLPRAIKSAWEVRVPAGLLIFLFLSMVAVFLTPLFVPDLDAERYFRFLSPQDRWMANLLIQNHLPSRFILAGGTAVMIALSISLFRFQRRRWLEGIWITVAFWSFLALALAHGPVAEVVNRYASMKPFAEEVAKTVGNQTLVHFGSPREDLLYYLNRPVPELDGEAAFQFFEHHPESFVLAIKTWSDSLTTREPQRSVLLEMNRFDKSYRLIGPAIHQSE